MESCIAHLIDRSLVSYLASIQLMPYLYDVTRKASSKNASCLFTLAELFPTDTICQTLDGEYMIGEHLLVIPVHPSGSLMEYYLPEGIWTNYLTGKSYIGGKWYKDTILSHQPFLFIRDNSVIPTAIKEVPGHHNIQFRVYMMEESIRIADSFYDQYTSQTWSYVIRQLNQKLTLSSDSNMLYSFRLMNQIVTEADHGFVLEEGLDTIIEPDRNAAIVTIQLQKRKDSIPCFTRKI